MNRAAAEDPALRERQTRSTASSAAGEMHLGGRGARSMGAVDAAPSLIAYWSRSCQSERLPDVRKSGLGRMKSSLKSVKMFNPIEGG